MMDPRISLLALGLVAGAAAVVGCREPDAPLGDAAIGRDAGASDVVDAGFCENIVVRVVDRPTQDCIDAEITFVVLGEMYQPPWEPCACSDTGCSLSTPPAREISIGVIAPGHVGQSYVVETPASCDAADEHVIALRRQ